MMLWKIPSRLETVVIITHKHGITVSIESHNKQHDHFPELLIKKFFGFYFL